MSRKEIRDRLVSFGVAGAAVLSSVLPVTAAEPTRFCGIVGDHLITSGETFNGVAGELRISPDALAVWNPEITNRNLILAGHHLRVPPVPCPVDQNRQPAVAVEKDAPDAAQELPLGVSDKILPPHTNWWYQLSQMNKDTANRYDITVRVVNTRTGGPSIDQISFRYWAPEQEKNELFSWWRDGGKTSQPYPKGAGRMETPIDPNYNGGDMVWHIQGMQPVPKDGPIPWIADLSNNSDKTANIEITTSTYYQTPDGS